MSKNKYNWQKRQLYILSSEKLAGSRFPTRPSR